MREEQILECFGNKLETVKVTSELEEVLKRNLLWNFLCTDKVTLLLLFLTSEQRDDIARGYNFKKLLEVLRKMYPERNTKSLRKCLEKSLDILLDVGLFKPDWHWQKREESWERLFFNRNEITKRIMPYKGYVAKRVLQLIDLMQLLKLLSFGPHENWKFFQRVLDINAYLAHIGDIIDPDHWKIEGEFINRISYTDIWKVLNTISDEKIYNADVKFYQDRKKVSIYGLESWLEGRYPSEVEKFTQCKLRFILVPEEIEDNDLVIKKFSIVPIVNTIIGLEKGSNGREGLYPSRIDDITYELVLHLVREFLERAKSKGDFVEKWKITNIDCRWYKIRNKEKYKELKAKFRQAFKNLDIKIQTDSGSPISTQHNGIRDELVPSVVCKKIKNIEDTLVKFIKKVAKLAGEEVVLVTLARKGDALIGHLCDQYSEIKNDLKQFGGNLDDSGKFENKSELEFLREFRKMRSKEIVIFDDAIDEGRKIVDVIEKVKKEGTLRDRKIKIVAFLANREKYKKFEERLRQMDINIKLEMVGHILR